VTAIVFVDWFARGRKAFGMSDREERRTSVASIIAERSGGSKGGNTNGMVVGSSAKESFA
jgi:hypothetical protein